MNTLDRRHLLTTAVGAGAAVAAGRWLEPTVTAANLAVQLGYMYRNNPAVQFCFRAVREGDEREHHAPGYALVMGGVIMIGIGIAGAMSDQAAMALLASAAGLILVALGATRHTEAAAH